jgi:hypothetical protein
MKFHAFSMSLGIVAIALLLATGALGAEPAPVQVRVKAKEAYLCGLPLVVAVEVTNTSAQPVETFQPHRTLHTVHAGLKSEGAHEYLQKTRHITHIVESQKIIVLKPGEKTTAMLDLSMMFQDDLPPGRYQCVVSYTYGKKPGDVKLLVSEPALITITEPTDPYPETQRELRLTMLQFLAARSLLNEEMPQSRELAYRLFAHILMNQGDSEYGRVSAYYKVTSELDPKARLEAWLNYLKHPAVDTPGLLDPDDFLRTTGIYYLKAGNLQLAKETLQRMKEQDGVTRYYLKQIEAASLPETKQ